MSPPSQGRANVALPRNRGDPCWLSSSLSITYEATHIPIGSISNELHCAWHTKQSSISVSRVPYRSECWASRRHTPLYNGSNASAHARAFSDLFLLVSQMSQIICCVPAFDPSTTWNPCVQFDWGLFAHRDCPARTGVLHTSA